MGIYEKVNERYAKTFYSKEFDQQWKTWKGMVDSLGLMESTMVSHSKTMEKVNAKRDIYINGPTAFRYLVDSLERNKIPLMPHDIMLQAYVHAVYRTIPTDGLKFDNAVKEMIRTGQITKSASETFPIDD